MNQELWVCGGIQQVRIYTLKHKLVATHERAHGPASARPISTICPPRRCPV